MKSKIKSKRTTVCSEYVFMNSMDTDTDSASFIFADRHSDDSVSFEMTKEEAEKLKKHLDYFLKPAPEPKKLIVNEVYLCPKGNSHILSELSYDEDEPEEINMLLIITKQN